MSRITRQLFWDSLSESNRAKYDKIMDRYTKICMLIGICGTFYVVTHFWHWPFLLALTLGSVLGVLVCAVIAFAPVWSVLFLAAIFGRKTPPAADPDKE